MPGVEFTVYLRDACPTCGEVAECSEIEVNPHFQPTFRYKCKCGHKHSRLRLKALDHDELEAVVAFTKKERK